MLDKLDGRVPAQDGLAPLPPVNHLNTSVASDSTNTTQAGTGGASSDGDDTASTGGGDSSNNNNNTIKTEGSTTPTTTAASGNTIGQLQELCVHRGHPMPMYDLEKMDGQPHQRSFSMKVRVGQLVAEGEGTSKKDAKRDAAAKMVQMLSPMKSGQNGSVKKENGAGGPEADGGSSPAPGGYPRDKDSNKQQAVVDQDFIHKMESMQLKIEPLTTDQSVKIQEFYQNLKDSPDSELRRLHSTPLNAANGKTDFVGMLDRLGEEQKFRVTYVDLDDDCQEDGRSRSLVQLSTFPVAVCVGAAAEAAKARQEAAMNALVYIKTMTKKRASEESGSGASPNGN